MPIDKRELAAAMNAADLSSLHGFSAKELFKVVGPLIAGLVFAVLNREKALPAPTPKPTGTAPEDLGDDNIPVPPPKLPPAAAGKVAKVMLQCYNIQVSKALHGADYTPDNPFGMLPAARVKAILTGKEKCPRESKLWFTLSAFDKDGRELTKADIEAAGLAYQTVFHIEESGGAVSELVGDPSNVDKGASRVLEGDPQIGHGITAYKNSNGFNHQIKVGGDGYDFTVSGSVAGVDSGKAIGPISVD